MTVYSHDVQGFISGKGTDFSLQCHIQTGYGLHATFCPLGTMSSLPEDRAATFEACLIPQIFKVKNV
jgi:hypothetical protein